VHRDSNFGNNLSIFDWSFGTASLTGDEPRAFGLAEERAAYPHDHILRQWTFAFRPRAEAVPEQASSAALGGEPTAE
jgi:hypothetical protein